MSLHYPYIDTTDEDAAAADLANDDAAQDEFEREREAFQRWYERRNRDDVIHLSSAWQAWCARAGL